MTLKLLPFQVEAVSRMVHFLQHNKSRSTYNASDPGTGKTAMTLYVTRKIVMQTTLIICPAVAKLVWRNEIKKWSHLGMPRVLTIRGKQDLHLLTKDHEYDFVIVSYNMLSGRRKKGELKRHHETLDALMKHHWSLLILDEAHNVKNRKAECTKAILQNLWKNCHYRIALSGTPFTSSIIDGHTLFEKMAPEAFPDFWKFAHRYCNVTRTPFGHKFEGVKNHIELKRIIREEFFIRYRKDEVMSDLPEKIFNEIPLDWKQYTLVPRGKDEKEQLRMEAEVVKRNLKSSSEVVAPSCLAEHLKLQALKTVPAIVEFVRDQLDQDIPVVLFAYHTDVIAELKLQLKAYSPVAIQGSTPDKLREAHVKAFVTEETSLFIGQVRAAGESITLCRPRAITVFAEIPWNPSTIEQAISRLDRYGAVKTERGLMIYYFVAENSIQEDIIRAVLSKSESFKKVIG